MDDLGARHGLRQDLQHGEAELVGIGWVLCDQVTQESVASMPRVRVVLPPRPDTPFPSCAPDVHMPRTLSKYEINPTHGA